MIYPRFRLYATFKTYLDTLKGVVAENKEDYREQLESALSARYATEHVLVVHQARLALYHVIRALVSKTGKKGVAILPYTLFDVVNMVIAAGAEPVFIDSRENSLDMDIDKLSVALATGDICAAVVTHYHRPDSHVREIAEMCGEQKVRLIEDCAISFGGKSCGDDLGTIGDFGILSFGRMKNISAYYGGALIAKDGELVEEVRAEIAKYPTVTRTQLLPAFVFNMAIETMTSPLCWSLFFHRLFAFGYRRDIEAITMLIRPDKNMSALSELPQAYKLQISNLQCKLVMDQMPQVEKHQKIRQQKAQKYYDQLRVIDERICRLVPGVDEGDPYLEFPIVVEDRKKVYSYLIDHGFDCRLHYYRNCADLEIFSAYRAECPNIEYVENHIIMLSLYPGYPDRTIDEMTALLAKMPGWTSD